MVVGNVCDVLRLYVLPPDSMSRKVGNGIWSICDLFVCGGSVCTSVYWRSLLFSRSLGVPFLPIALPKLSFWLLLPALSLPLASGSDDCRSIADLVG